MQLADLGRLVEQHHGAVVAVAFATTRDLALAEDVAQETFIAAWDARDTLRDPARTRSWLCGIARNLSRNALRRRRREVGGAEGDVVTDDKPSAVESALDEERRRELRTALDDVPLAYREPLVLFYWEDRSIAQVASALGVTEEAAQKRISRARTMLRAELEEPLETTGRGRKSAAAAAAAVLAVLATRTGVAHAAIATKKGTAMSIVKGAGVIAVGGLIVGAIALARDARSAAPQVAPASAEPRERAAPAVAAPPELPDDPDMSAVAATGLSAARGAVPVPSEGYEITVVSPTSVAVELAGGRGPVSSMPSFTFSAPQPERHITGRVLDDAGQPVAGAVVLVGDQLDAFQGAFRGSGAAKSGPDGAFAVTTRDSRAGFAIALHPRAWSHVVPVPGGRGDAAITLTAPTNGSFTAHVTRAGAAREASVILTMPGGGARMALQTDAAGELRVPLLAPGTYNLRVAAGHGFLGGFSMPVSRDVTIVRGRAGDVPLDLPIGSQLLITAHKPGMQMVDYFFYPGTEPAPLDDLKKRSRNGGDVMNFLYGGVDADHRGHLHDVLPGTYTLCVLGTTQDSRTPLACRRVDIAGDQPTVEVAVDVKL